MTDPPAPVRVTQVMIRLSRDGGVQAVVRGIARHVAPSRIDLAVVTVRPPYEEDELDAVAAEIHSLGIAARPLRVRDRVRIIRGTARAIRRLRPDVVHLHSGTSWYAIGAPLVAPRTRFLIEVHDAPGSGRQGRLSDRFEGAWARWARGHVVCHSEPVRSDVERIWRLPATRLHQFPLGVDTDVMAPERARRAKRPTLVVVGRLVPSKRFDLAVDVLAGLLARGHDVDLAIVGQGPERSNLAAIAARHDIDDRVRFVGPRFGAELVEVITSSHALLSTSEYEGFGLTIVEAMACGVPVVAMRAGGVAELLDAGGGILVDPGDVVSMVERVSELLDDDDLRRRIGSAGVRVATTRYAMNTMADRFTELYEALASSR